MKPFDNVAISPTEPKNKADVWIQHSINILKPNVASFSAYGVTGTNNDDGSILVSGNATSSNVYLIGLKRINKDDISSGDYTLSINNEEGMSDVSVRLRKVSTSGSKTEIITQALDTINKEISLNSNNLVGSDTSYIELDLYLKTQRQYNFTIYPQFQRGEATEYEAPVEDDILINNSGVYNSILPRKSAISAGITTSYALKSTSWEKINLNKIHTQTGNKFSIEDGNIIIGNAKNILVNSNMMFSTGFQVGDKLGIEIRLNDSAIARIYQPALDTRDETRVISNKLLNVNKGDKISLYVQNVTAIRGTVYNGQGSNYITVAEI